MFIQVIYKTRISGPDNLGNVLWAIPHLKFIQFDGLSLGKLM